MTPQELAQKNAHIPTAEIQQDILDTERDIVKWTEEAENLGNTPFSLPDARWNHMRADARRSRIKEAEKFIENLKSILEVRNEQRT